MTKRKKKAKAIDEMTPTENILRDSTRRGYCENGHTAPNEFARMATCMRCGVMFDAWDQAEDDR